MKKTFLLLGFLLSFSIGYGQIISPNGDNLFYYNGAADVTFRYLPRGVGGRAMVHDVDNVLTLNYGGDFTGGTRIGHGFLVYPSGKMLISRALNTNDYTYVGQHQAQVRIVNALGAYGSRALEIALLDNGTGVIQANEMNVGYNDLLLNPVSGNVGIGTSTPQERLSVSGKIRAKEIKVEVANWPDYVFEDNYELTPLKKLEDFIGKNKHLPDVPSALEVKEIGVELGEMNKVLLKKIEELTLHLIQKEKELNRINEENRVRDAKISQLEKMINSRK